MTSKFREALGKFETITIDWSDPNKKWVHNINDDDYETIRQALLIAERLERGEVSDKMIIKAQEIISNSEFLSATDTFKAMAKQMIEEVELMGEGDYPEETFGAEHFERY